MWLIVGLGNPGAEYAMNRHNVGFMAVDVIADEYGIGPWRAKHKGLMAEGRIGAEKVVLLKPQTYMNESGQSVGALANFYKIDPNRIIVFFDELDLDPGKVRVKTGGGNAGHKGLKSIQAHLGTPDFHRVRIGIGHPGDKGRVTGYVLGNFPKESHDDLADLLAALSGHVPLLLSERFEDYMTKVAHDAPVKKDKD